jgi:hypothetical protein
VQGSPTGLTPEQYLDLVDQFAKHPGFVGDLSLAFDSVRQHQRLAFKGDKRWGEFNIFEGATNLKEPGPRVYMLQTIGQVGRPLVALDPTRKVFTEMAATGTMGSFFDKAKFLALAQQLRVAELRKDGNRITFDGRAVDRYVITLVSESGGFEVLVAPDLLGLPVSLRVIGSSNGLWLRLTNVSLDVPDSLFVVPADHTRVTMDEFFAPIRAQVKAE